MSGIAGIIRFDGGPIERGLIEKMTAAMDYRGPDGINHWVRGSVALGQCMLRTTPESLEETQPLTNEDESLVLVMDGRVDNWEELRIELLSRGAKLRTRADAELVLRSYEVWGKDCVSHIDGDFAFVIWNERQQEAFCARDRMGNKPFNYHWDRKTLTFASELHTILALPWVQQVPNEGMIAESLGNDLFTRDETWWRDVLRLVPAHTLLVGENGIKSTQYWEPDYWAQLPSADERELAENYRAVLAEQVRRMSRSHKIVAYEVSGGLDSSALFALAEQLRRGHRLEAPEIVGYSLAFPGNPAADELEYIRAVAYHLQCDVHEVPPVYMPYSWYVEYAKLRKEFPGYPNGEMLIGLRKSARAAGSRTIITGVGGDEWVGIPSAGSYYAEEIELGNWGNVYQCFLADWGALGVGQTIWWLLRHGFAPFLPSPIKNTLHKLRSRNKEQASWLSPILLSIFKVRRAMNESRPWPDLPRRGQRTQYRILYDAFSAFARELEERQTSNLGLDLRSPFHSRAIIELAFSTPERFRSRGRTTKSLHRKALATILPDEVVNRKTKADFMSTFTTQLDYLGEAFFIEMISRRKDWVQPELMAKVYQGFRNGDSAGVAEWILWTFVGCDALLPKTTCHDS